MIKAVILDFDGVLTLSEEFVPIWKELSIVYDCDSSLIKSNFLNLDNAYLKGEITNHDFWQTICLRSNIPFDLEKINSLFFKDKVKNVTFSNFVASLPVKKFVLSNNFLELKPVISSIANYCDDIFLSSEIGHTKSEEACFLDVLDKLGLQPQDVIFIDDSLGNCNVASNLGIHAIHFTDTKEVIEKMSTYF